MNLFDTKICSLIKRKKQFLSFFGFLLITHLIWLLSFYPGVMSHDSIVQWNQSGTLHLNDTHPYIHTLYIYILRLLYDNPVSIVLFQIIFSVAIFASIFNFFYEKGLKKTSVLLAFLYFISIPIGIYTITLWKDIPFSLALLGLSFFFFVKLGKSNKLSNWNFSDWLVFFLLSFVVIFFRHNGIIYLLFTPLFVFFYFRGKREKFVIATFFISTFLVFSVILPNILNVTEKKFWSKDVYIYHSMVGFYANEPDTYISNKSKALLDSLVPKEVLLSNYTPVSWNPIYWGIKNDLDEELFDSVSFWYELKMDFFKNHLYANFPFFIKQRMEMFNAGLLGKETLLVSDIPEKSDLHGLQRDFTGLNGKLRHLLERTSEEKLTFFIWNSLVPLLFLTFLLVWSLFRKFFPSQIYSLMLLISAPFLFIFNVDGDWRYFYFYYLSFLVTIPILLYNLKCSKN